MQGLRLWLPTLEPLTAVTAPCRSCGTVPHREFPGNSTLQKKHQGWQVWAQQCCVCAKGPERCH